MFALSLYAKLLCRSLGPKTRLGSLMLVWSLLARHGKRCICSIDLSSNFTASLNSLTTRVNYLAHCISHCVDSLGALLLRALILVAEVGGVSLQFITDTLVWAQRVDTLTMEFVLLLDASGVEVAWEICLELLNILIRPRAHRLGIHAIWFFCTI